MSVVIQGREFIDQRLRQILVQFDLHPIIAGMDGTGKSSPAEAAAKAMTARNPSGLTVGKSART